MRRCAIYTRKSSEEGLDQAFNSLDAQREACAAYVMSQTHEGWTVLEAVYDDGGISGGTMERPALQRLLEDVRAGRIDIVVVYKVDRLTRSLADFAKIVEAFDAHGVSFVSVTQAFSTTTSMGRLTLNMLLSFAQFEREVTAERIRDKIAASKRKGLWMGGLVPFGYDADGRTLKVNEGEAETVRTLFRLYLELGCVSAVKDEAARLGLKTRERPHFRKNATGGLPFNRGHLYQLLNNALYIGRIVHKGESHPGQHPAIIDQDTWEAVQRGMAANIQGTRRRKTSGNHSLLAGLISDGRERKLVASHASRKGLRYRYYVSPPGTPKAERLSLPALEVEAMVIAALVRELNQGPTLLDRVADASINPNEARRLVHAAQDLAGLLAGTDTHQAGQILAKAISAIVLGDGVITISFAADGIASLIDTRARSEGWKVSLPIVLRRRGQALRMIIDGDDPRPPGEPDPALVKAIVRAHDWFQKMLKGATPESIARAENLTRSYVTRVVRLAFLAPDLVQAIVDGTAPKTLSADHLVQRSAELPLAWETQRFTVAQM
jgi:DNA invertase Pin-like site-specific DNA recombinase